MQLKDVIERVEKGTQVKIGIVPGKLYKYPSKVTESVLEWATVEASSISLDDGGLTFWVSGRGPIRSKRPKIAKAVRHSRMTRSLYLSWQKGNLSTREYRKMVQTLNELYVWGGK